MHFWKTEQIAERMTPYILLLRQLEAKAVILLYSVGIARKPTTNLCQSSYQACLSSRLAWLTILYCQTCVPSLACLTILGFRVCLFWERAMI